MNRRADDLRISVGVTIFVRSKNKSLQSFQKELTMEIDRALELAQHFNGEGVHWRIETRGDKPVFMIRLLGLELTVGEFPNFESEGGLEVWKMVLHRVNREEALNDKLFFGKEVSEGAVLLLSSCRQHGINAFGSAVDCKGSLIRENVQRRWLMKGKKWRMLLN